MKSPLLEPRSYELSTYLDALNNRFSAQSASGLNSSKMISPGVELGICDSNVLRLGENDLEFITSVIMHYVRQFGFSMDAVIFGNPNFNFAEKYILTESNFRDCRSCCQRLSSERDLSFNLAADLFSKICPFSP
ncbi:unnamed protein product [Rhizophagus irregularis]|nr:unnamed protein product [Rhizophagus irregularis]